MGELTTFVVTALSSSLAPLWLIRRDRRRLAARGEAHPWNLPTFACAVVVFGLLAIPAHYWVLRRSGAALAWSAAILALVMLAGAL